MGHFYFQSATRRMSLFLGAIVGVGVGIAFGVAWGLIAFAGTAILASFALALMLFFEDRPYRQLLKMIPAKVLHRERGMMHLKQQSVVPVCLYFGQGEMFLATFTKKTGAYFCRIPKKCVASIRLQNELGHFRICFYDRLCYDLFCQREEELMQLWQQQGWPIVDIPTDPER